MEKRRSASHGKEKTPAVAFGHSVRTYRQKLGISQEELAHRAKLDRSYFGAVERGDRNVTVKNIWRIALALECKPSELFREAERASKDFN